MRYWLNIIKKYLFRAKPLALNYFVTARCNCRCRHCFYDTETGNSSRDELTLDEIDKFASSMGSLLYVNITGGEPFLRKDLFDIVNIFHARTKPRKITVTTNGFFTEETVDFCKKAEALSGTLVEMNISIDALGEEHNSIRGAAGVFEKAIDTFNGIRTAGPAPNIRKGFILTFMKDNSESLQETIKYLSGLNPDFISLNLIRGEVKDPAQKEIDFGRFEGYLQDIGRIASRPEKGLFNRLRSAKTALILEYRKRIFLQDEYTCRCLAGTSIGVMYPDGSLSPCEMLDDGLGNIRDNSYDIGRIWKSLRAGAFRRKIRSEKCRCTHECFLTASTTFSMVHLFKIFIRSITKKDKPSG